MASKVVNFEGRKIGFPTTMDEADIADVLSVIYANESGGEYEPKTKAGKLAVKNMNRLDPDYPIAAQGKALESVKAEIKAGSGDSKKAIEKAASDLIKNAQEQARMVYESNLNVAMSVKNVSDSNQTLLDQIAKTIEVLDRPNITAFSVTTPEGRTYKVDLEIK
jgi:hypothetical protein